MKPIAAIWHIRGQGTGDYPVAIVDTYMVQGPMPAFGAIIVDSARQLRTALIGELEIVDEDVSAAVARAQAAWSGR